MTEALRTAWRRAVDCMACELPQRQFAVWIQPLRWRRATGDGAAQVVAPNACIRSWVLSRFAGRIERLLSDAAGGRAVRLDIVLPESEPPRPSAAGASAARQRTRRSPQRERSAEGAFGALSRFLGRANLQSKCCFEKFVSGKCNALALVAAKEVIQSNRIETHNPMLIIGDTALGKTHLMQAIGHEMLSRRPETRLLYISSELFVQQLVQALRSPDHDEVARFKRFFRSLDALLVDDVQFLAKKDASQAEFFSTFNALMDRRGQVVLTSDRHPQDIKGLQRRLQSRFTWGMPVAIEPPDKETRLSILKQKAKDQGATLPDEVADLLAERITSNVRELEGALNRALAEARSNGGRMTADSTLRILTDLLEKQRQHVSLEDIQRVTAAYYQVSTAAMLSRSRRRTLVRPRQMAMTLARELTRHSLPEIGKAFGGRDHTTVIHAHRRINALSQTDPEARSDRRALMRQLAPSPE